MIPEYDALLIGTHEFPEQVMEQCSKLKIICKHGAGLDNIRLDKAKELGIAVCNVSGTNSNAVADLTLIGVDVCAKSDISERNFEKITRLCLQSKQAMATAKG